jgi:hypothetical protein
MLTTHVKYFEGVYPVDLLPETITNPANIVVNLDEHYMLGSHWVALSPTLVTLNILTTLEYHL